MVEPGTPSTAVPTTLPPVCAAFLRSNGTGEVMIGHHTTTITCPTLIDARNQAMRIVAEAAKRHATTVSVTCSDPEGLFRFFVAPNGVVTEAPSAATSLTSALRPTTTPSSSSATADYLAPEPLSMPATPEEPEPVLAGTDGSGPRRAFIEPTGPTGPAEQGWRGALAKRGIPLPPSDAELTDRAHKAVVSRHWASPRTIAVVNGKGGAGKTPTTICLAAVFARHGGAGVLAWDNNQTRGTLGWRTEQDEHQATLLDLLPQTPQLLNADASSADLTRFVHHQSRDLYDVLRSKAIVLADEQRITPQNVDAIWRVATKYYRLIIMDSGNDESDPMWRRMIDHTDQLVTVTTTRADHAEAGALLLEALVQRDERSAVLARNAVTIITQADPKASDESIRRIRDGYATLTRQVVFIPYDPAMVEGTLSYDSLRPVTQRAWLTAAAAAGQYL